MAVVFPMRSDVDGMATRRDVPMSGGPDVATAMPVPVALNPNMMP